MNTFGKRNLWGWKYCVGKEFRVIIFRGEHSFYEFMVAKICETITICSSYQITLPTFGALSGVNAYFNILDIQALLIPFVFIRPEILLWLVVAIIQLTYGRQQSIGIYQWVKFDLWKSLYIYFWSGKSCNNNFRYMCEFIIWWCL